MYRSSWYHTVLYHHSIRLSRFQGCPKGCPTGAQALQFLSPSWKNVPWKHVKFLTTFLQVQKPHVSLWQSQFLSWTRKCPSMAGAPQIPEFFYPYLSLSWSCWYLFYHLAHSWLFVFSWNKNNNVCHKNLHILVLVEKTGTYPPSKQQAMKMHEYAWICMNMHTRPKGWGMGRRGCMP